MCLNYAIWSCHLLFLSSCKQQWPIPLCSSHPCYAWIWSSLLLFCHFSVLAGLARALTHTSGAWSFRDLTPWKHQCFLVLSCIHRNSSEIIHPKGTGTAVSIPCKECDELWRYDSQETTFVHHSNFLGLESGCNWLQIDSKVTLLPYSVIFILPLFVLFQK